MTIYEAIDAGIREVRCEPWNPYCRMELPDFRGPWGHIIDPAGNRACGNPAEHKIDVLFIDIPGQISCDPTKDEWEPWKRPADYDQKFTAPEQADAGKDGQ